MLIIVFVGFAPTFYLRPIFGTIDEPTGSPSLPWHLVFHGLSMSAWYVLFVAQSLLVTTRRTHHHRKLGIVGLVSAVCSIVSGFLVLMLLRIRRIPQGEESLTPLLPIELDVVIFQTYSFFFFALFIVLAAIYRKRAFLHKRLMFLASVLVLGAAFAGQRGFGVVRAIIPESSPLSLNSYVELLLLASLFFHDWTRHRKIYAVTIIGTIIAFPARLFVVQAMTNNETGRSYVEWLTSLLHNTS